MRDGLAAGVGDDSIDVADGSSHEVFGGAHFEIGELETGGVWRRSRGGFGMTAKQEREDDGDDNDNRDRDGDSAPAGIALFGYGSWLDQAAHASRLYSGILLPVL